MNAAVSAVHPSLTPAPGYYRLDPERTKIRFRTRHMFGFGRVRGEFALRRGHVQVAGSIGASRVLAVVDAGSFGTGHPTRDRMVRSRTYLDTATYPDIQFVADAVETSGDGWLVDGTLEAHGVQVPLRLTVDAVDASSGQVTLRASGQVDRYAHGITAGRGIAGRRLAIEITAVAYPAAA